ncbi:MAG: phosphotransferase [Methylomicrobium sp.]
MLAWLMNDLSLPVDRYQPASSDASFRRYFRVDSDQNSFIVMDAPPDKENLEPFIKIAGLLSKHEIRVPTIFEINRADGFLLLEDFGSTNYLDGLNASTAEYLYQAALDSLFKQQTRIPPRTTDIPSYDRALLARELTIFEEWFVGRFLDKTLPQSLRADIDHILIESALEQPVTFIHRDYHSRNLMILGNEVGVLDFQDAVIGPITYDLVSLLKDCYIDWPETLRQRWLTNYYAQLHQAGLIDCHLDTFTRWFDLMGLQRHLKAIGIFSRLHLRDAKSGYLQDIPRTLNYVVTTCNRYAELSELSAFLNKELLPAYRHRP